MVFGQSALDACTANQYLFEAYCHYSPDFSVLWRPMVSAYMFGIGPRFAAVEHLQPGAVAYGVFIVAVSAYLSIPLLQRDHSPDTRASREPSLRSSHPPARLAILASRALARCRRTCYHARRYDAGAPHRSRRGV